MAAIGWSSGVEMLGSQSAANRSLVLHQGTRVSGFDHVLCKEFRPRAKPTNPLGHEKISSVITNDNGKVRWINGIFSFSYILLRYLLLYILSYMVQPLLCPPPRTNQMYRVTDSSEQTTPYVFAWKFAASRTDIVRDEGRQ
jgi:hypothetical protein